MIRGVLAVVFCLFIFGRGFTDLVIGGIREAGATTVRWVFVQSLEPLDISHIPAPVWSILVVRLLSHLYSPILTFQPQETWNYSPRLGLAVNVTPLWDVEGLSDYFGNQSALDLPSCERTGSFCSLLLSGFLPS